jgi:hypothetical protein
MFGLFRRKEKDLSALRAYFLHHECDLSDGIPSEDTFQEWLLYDCDPDDASYYEDLGECALARASNDSEADVWQWLGGEDARSAWQHYQRANQSWGALQWVARAYSWVHGLPWF